MFYFADITAAARLQNSSALPNAPKVLDIEPTPRRPWQLRERLARLLRQLAGRQLRMAETLDPVGLYA